MNIFILGCYINPAYRLACDEFLRHLDTPSIQEHFDAVNMFDGCAFE